MERDALGTDNELMHFFAGTCHSFTANPNVRGYGFYALFFLLFFSDLCLVCNALLLSSCAHITSPHLTLTLPRQILKTIAPQQMPPAPYEAGSIREIGYLMSQFGHPEFDGWYEFLIVAQFGLEVGLFFACAATVRWPQRALIREQGLSKWLLLWCKPYTC